MRKHVASEEKPQIGVMVLGVEKPQAHYADYECPFGIWRYMGDVEYPWQLWRTDGFWFTGELEGPHFWYDLPTIDGTTFDISEP